MRLALHACLALAFALARVPYCAAQSSPEQKTPDSVSLMQNVADNEARVKNLRNQAAEIVRNGRSACQFPALEPDGRGSFRITIAVPPGAKSVTIGPICGFILARPPVDASSLLQAADYEAQASVLEIQAEVWRREAILLRDTNRSERLLEQGKAVLESGKPKASDHPARNQTSPGEKK